MRKQKKSKSIPIFQSEKEESAFWDKTDSTEYFSSQGNIRIKMPPQTKNISIRLPQQLLKRLKKLANLKDVPYQSLLKIYLDERVREEIFSIKKSA